MYDIYLATSVNFSQPVYHIVEDEGLLEVVVILSNPSAIDITITVFSNHGSATGKI